MNKELSLLLCILLHYFLLFADDVGTALLVELHLTSSYHLIHPVDRELSVTELLFPWVELFLQLLDLDVLLLDFRG